MENQGFKFDEIGSWSVTKHEIIKDYAREYTKILESQKKITTRLTTAYIDAFAGSGTHVHKDSGEFIKGSPLNALEINPKFDDYYYIELDESKSTYLRQLTNSYQDVNIYNGDCNEVLLTKIFPLVKYNDYRRALCLLDPYGLQLDWEVIEFAGNSKSIEIFLNFPVMDINRNVIWSRKDGVSDYNIERMNRFWGDDSWIKIIYNKQTNLFGEEIQIKKSNINSIVEAFKNRLKNKAGFEYVPDPIPMRIGKGSIVYYLFFASPKAVAAHIVKHIFSKYELADITQWLKQK